MTPKEIIANKMIHRSSEDGEIACGHRLGDDDAEAIITALDAAGFMIVPKDSAAGVMADALADATRIRREIYERKAEIRAGARTTRTRFQLNKGPRT